MKEERFYGYKHWTLEEVPRCFYVGKGLRRRPFTTSGDHRSSKWHAIVERFGLRVEVCIGPVTNEEVSTWEKEWILKEDTYTENYSFNDPDIRCNFTCGGDGTPGRVVSTSARQRIGAAQRGKPKPEETREKIRAALTGQVLSDVTRHRMSLAKRGRLLSEEHRKNLWANRTREFTDEHRRNLSIAAKNRRKKMSDIKQVIVVRKDLSMRKGKIAAQVAHAAMKFIVDDLDPASGAMYRKLNKAEKAWLNGAFAKVVVYVETEDELRRLMGDAATRGVTCKHIIDAGRTEFHGVPTLTCAAFGPDEVERLDQLTGHLKLL